MYMYSEVEEGGYCKFCVLFRMCEHSMKELGVLANRPLTKFKNASEILREHFHDTCKPKSGSVMDSRGRRIHQVALERATTFAARMKTLSLSIDCQVSLEQSKRIAKNVGEIQSIVETVILCERQGITHLHVRR